MTSWIWIAAGVGLIGIELAAPSYLFFLSLGLAAVAAGIAQLAGITAGWQGSAMVFVLASLASLIPLWKMGQRLREKGYVPSNVDALIGQEGKVLGVLGSTDSPTGYLVQIGREQWSARLADVKVKIVMGSAVRVLRVDGVTLIVEKGEV